MNYRWVVRIGNGKSFSVAENLEKIAQIFEIKAQELFIAGCFLAEDEMKEKIIKRLNCLDASKLKALYLMSVNL